MRRRTDRHQVHRHQLGINIPAVLQKSLVGQPAHRERVPAVQHPLPVNAPVKGRRQRLNARISGKILAAEQHPAQQQRGIDRRQLAAEHSFPALNVDEVVKKTVLVRTLFQQKSQRLFHALFAKAGEQIIPFGGDAQTRSSQSR